MKRRFGWRFDRWLLATFVYRTRCVGDGSDCGDLWLARSGATVRASCVSSVSGQWACRCAAIIDELSWRTASAAGRRVVAVQDTTEINFSGRDRGPVRATARRWAFSSRRGGGDAEEKRFWGFQCHVMAAARRTGASVVSRTRWLDGARAASARLGTARQVIVVGDRESDIYPAFARRPDDVELIARGAEPVPGLGNALFDAAPRRTASWRRSGPSRARRRARPSCGSARGQ